MDVTILSGFCLTFRQYPFCYFALVFSNGLIAFRLKSGFVFVQVEGNNRRFAHNGRDDDFCFFLLLFQTFCKFGKVSAGISYHRRHE